MFEIDETVKVRIPVSNLWFNAFIREIKEGGYLVETYFQIQGQGFWEVDETNIKKVPEVRTRAPNVSTRFQNKLREIITKTTTEK